MTVLDEISLSVLDESGNFVYDESYIPQLYRSSMLISAHEANNQYYYQGGTPWAFGWTSQNLVSSSEVTATGGEYE